MIIQLNPSIPLERPKGKGQALFLIDPGIEHHLMWVIAIDETGEIWTFSNPEVRAQKNITVGRLIVKSNLLFTAFFYFLCEVSENLKLNVMRQTI